MLCAEWEWSALRSRWGSSVLAHCGVSGSLKERTSRSITCVSPVERKTVGGWFFSPAGKSHRLERWLSVSSRTTIRARSCLSAEAYPWLRSVVESSQPRADGGAPLGGERKGGEMGDSDRKPVERPEPAPRDGNKDDARRRGRQRESAADRSRRAASGR
jgi:hypothetical protein